MIRYSEEHEYAIKDGDVIKVGISQHAVEQLGDIVFVDLPQPGQSFGKDQECAVVESVKAASDIYCPVQGVVVDVNTDLNDDPELVNRECLEGGWMFTLRPTDWDEVDALMDEDQYAKFIE